MIRPFLKYVIIIGDSEDIGKESCRNFRYLKSETRWHRNLVYNKMTIILKFCYSLNSFMFRIFLNYIVNGFLGFGYQSFVSWDIQSLS